MRPLSIFLLFIIVVVIVRIVIRTRRDDRLAAMTDEQLQIESYFAASGGDYPNEYSRERDRREQEHRLFGHNT